MQRATGMKRYIPLMPGWLLMTVAYCLVPFGGKNLGLHSARVKKLMISLLEAMYMKKFCIVSDVRGNRDVIRSGYNGYVCKAVDEYVQGISNYVSIETEQLISNAYEDILDKYNIDIMIKKYKQIYQSSIS